MAVQCPVCRYDLDSCPSRCPECGNNVVASVVDCHLSADRSFRRGIIISFIVLFLGMLCISLINESRASMSRAQNASLSYQINLLKQRLVYYQAAPSAFNTNTQTSLSLNSRQTYSMYHHLRGAALLNPWRMAAVVIWGIGMLCLVIAPRFVIHVSQLSQLSYAHGVMLCVFVSTALLAIDAWRCWL